MPDYGRERIVLVEIDQPLCSKQWGDAFASPTPASGCHAALGVDADLKCFNTRATCPVPDDYTAGTLTLRFAERQQELVRYYGYVIPSLIGHDTAPGEINLAALYGSATPLGRREVVTLTFEDHVHSDLLVDKYRLQRQTGAAASGSPAPTYDPYTRGTFWGKFLARNPYHAGYPLRVYEGFLGDAIEDMRVRHYIIDRIEGPSEGVVKIVAKDLFSKVEEKKAVAPAASRGELGSNITSASTSATLSPAGIGEEDYPHLPGSPSELYVAIGKEIIRCSRSGDTLHIIERACFGTEEEDHEDEDLVQWVLVYPSSRAHEIIYNLLVDYGGVPAESIPFSTWEEQADQVTNLYHLRVAKPTAVAKLVGEICQQAGVTVWHDPSTGYVNLRALRPSNSSATITDDGWIIEGSISTKRQDDKRRSQVWVYYGQKNPLESLDDPRNYTSRVVVVDADAEGEEQYGTPKVEEIFSRYIPAGGRTSAIETGELMLSIFRDPPIEARLSLDAGRDDESIGLARFVTLETADIQDATGDVEGETQFAIVSLERSEAQLHIVAQEVSFASVPGTNAESDPRTIFIENSTVNVNMRTLHDSLYEAPVDGSPNLVVAFVVIDGVTVGSTSTSTAAMRTGSWPTTVSLALTNEGRIQGKGGQGGAGGNGISGGAGNGVNGEQGGPALQADRALTVNNASGEIWGGGGGGGGGGAMYAYDSTFSPPVLQEASGGGSGGGGGAGTNGGNTANPGTDYAFTPYLVIGGTVSSPGTSTTGGAPGSPGRAQSQGTANVQGGVGGNGGAPGQAGTAGSFGTFFSGEGFTVGTPGNAGAAGNYIVGNAFVTWTAVGDVRGSAA